MAGPFRSRLDGASRRRAAQATSEPRFSQTSSVTAIFDSPFANVILMGGLSDCLEVERLVANGDCKRESGPLARCKPQHDDRHMPFILREYTLTCVNF